MDSNRVVNPTILERSDLPIIAKSWYLLPIFAEARKQTCTFWKFSHLKKALFTSGNMTTNKCVAIVALGKDGEQRIFVAYLIPDNRSIAEQVITGVT
jgi:hypothetical protein